MKRRAFERRRALCARISRGLEFECRRTRKGLTRTLERLAKACGLSQVQALGLLNPTRPKPPAAAVRVALEEFSARWPGGRVRAREWWR